MLFGGVHSMLHCANSDGLREDEAVWDLSQKGDCDGLEDGCHTGVGGKERRWCHCGDSNGLGNYDLLHCGDCDGLGREDRIA